MTAPARLVGGKPPILRQRLIQAAAGMMRTG